MFARISGGNAISYPLGLKFGRAAKIGLQSALDALFSGPFGTGCPLQDTARKQADTEGLKDLWRHGWADAGRGAAAEGPGLFTVGPGTGERVCVRGGKWS